MSQPPPPPPPQPPPPPPQPPSSHLPLLPFSTTSTTSSNNREYRKGNWTLQETLTLITAKKLDDERRAKPSSVASTSKPGELRWKWVENYCWAHGCYRSQNQCNDKWDNLLRDFKKVRDYQARSIDSSDTSNSFPSYWTMERHQRKYYNLPSNMSLEVYEALNEVVQRRYNTNITTIPQQQQQQLQQQQQYVPPFSLPPPTQPPVTSLPPETMAPETVVAMDAPAVSEGSESPATESSDNQDDSSGSKRRKLRSIGASIKRSARILAKTIRNSEENKDKRHRELMEFEQRRLQLEETRNEVNRQGMANLVVAVTKLSTAIQSLISDQT